MKEKQAMDGRSVDTRMVVEETEKRSCEELGHFPYAMANQSWYNGTSVLKLNLFSKTFQVAIYSKTKSPLLAETGD